MSTNVHAPLPATLIGGYLGAGKTTLVNHLLRHAGGLRLAVLVNEFGALPIDADLIEAQDENVISIAGGCICCSYGSDLMAALMDLALMERRPDHVLVETSGVALPGSVAQSIGLLDDYVLDAVTVLADAETIQAQAGDRFMGDTILRQLADADIVVLNKCDLVPPDQRAARKSWLATRCSNASIIETSHGQVAREVLIGPGSTEIRSRVPEGGVARQHDHWHSGDAAHYETFVVAVSPGSDPAAVGRALADAGLGLIRAKGFIAGPDGRTWLVQVVGRRYDVRPVHAEPRHVGQVVCIAPEGLSDQEMVQKALRQPRHGGATR